MNVRTLADLRREDEGKVDERTPLTVHYRVAGAQWYVVSSGNYRGGSGTPAAAAVAATAPARGRIAPALAQSLARESESQASESNGLAPRSMPIRFLELLFPYFTLKSVLLYISVVDWIMYIITVCLNTELPLIPAGRVLVDFGANVPPLIKKGQVWRLILPVFLHANFFHVFFNVFFQLRMGFAIERRYGLIRFAFLYFLAAVYGNLLSAAVFFCHSYKVGASTAGFGLIGVQLCELALTWHRMRHRDRMFLNIASFVLMMTLLTFTLNGSSIDQMGHLGGLICGVSMGLLYNDSLTDKPHWYAWMKWVAVAALIALPAACVPVIYAVDRHC